MLNYFEAVAEIGKGKAVERISDHLLYQLIDGMVKARYVTGSAEWFNASLSCPAGKHLNGDYRIYEKPLVPIDLKTIKPGTRIRHRDPGSAKVRYFFVGALSHHPQGAINDFLYENEFGYFYSGCSTHWYLCD